ncbi:MAG: hypothetical protein AAGI91_00095 [Bacteroidota bacterium]
MQAHRAEATVAGDGSITVRDVPFSEGEEVEVIVLPRVSASPSDRDALKGSVRRYTDPFDSAVDPDTWDAGRKAS